MDQNSKYESPRILVVDDELPIREILADFLSMEGFSVGTAPDGTAALEELSRLHYDMVISDLMMPNMGGIELLDAIAGQAPHLLTIIMTGFGTVETAIDAMKRGAYDYIMKPFRMEEVVHIVRRGLDRKALEAENLRLKEALSLYSASETIAASLSLEEVLRTLTNTSIQEVDADAVVVMLADGKGGYFERVRELNPNYHCVGSAGAICARQLSEHFDDGDALLVHGERGLGFFEAAPEGNELHSLMVTELKAGGRNVGYIALLSFSPGKLFKEGQRKLVSIVANRAAAFIENAKLYENLKRTFDQTILGFVNAIDKMDRYTAGHSEWVATYSQLLAVRLGLPVKDVEVVRQSALMHDIGKIGCSVNLNKPGRLSEAEYDEIRRHPEYGKEILEPIKVLEPILDGVHYHHERWDGTGYPRGLGENDIPLIARIISVADAYDAMTSHRAYRRALTHQTTVSEINDCAGLQFDPELAYEFCEAIEEYRKERADTGDSVPE